MKSFLCVCVAFAKTKKKLFLTHATHWHICSKSENCVHIFNDKPTSGRVCLKNLNYQEFFFGKILPYRCGKILRDRSFALCSESDLIILTVQIYNRFWFALLLLLLLLPPKHTMNNLDTCKTYKPLASILRNAQVNFFRMRINFGKRKLCCCCCSWWSPCVT